MCWGRNCETRAVSPVAGGGGGPYPETLGLPTSLGPGSHHLPPSSHSSMHVFEGAIIFLKHFS